MPAIVDRTKGKAGIRWDKIVGNIWKVIGNKKEIMSREDGGEYKTKVSNMIERS